MNRHTKQIIQFIGYVIILFIIYWLLTNQIKESFVDNALSVTDQPNPDTPAPNGYFPMTEEQRREGKTIVENDLMPGEAPSVTDFQIVPQPPPWRPPVHPMVAPALGDGGEGIADYMGLVNINLPWMSPIFQEFTETQIDTWVRNTSDPIEWPRGVERWNWRPFPNDKQLIEKWNFDLWQDANWRPPIHETKDNQSPKPPKIPIPYWKKWAMDWLNRWNGEETRTLNTEIPQDIRPKTLDYPFQYGRLHYVQGWDARVNNNKKTRIIQYFGELTRPFGQVVYLMDWIMVGDFDKLDEKPAISVAWIGSRTYDQVWLPNGNDPQSLTVDSTTPASPPPSLLTWADSENELRRIDEQNSLYRGNMKLAFQCFAPALNDDNKMKSNLVYAASKAECEDRIDYLGRPKPQGVWDRPCVSDTDCLFYGSNKNYKNTFGKCLNNGRCQFPLGMEHLGFRYFIPESDGEPYCYNCNTDKWLPQTEIGKCCEAQRDKSRYPFLNGPDFVFRGDVPERERYYSQTQCQVSGMVQDIAHQGYVRNEQCSYSNNLIQQMYPKEKRRNPIYLTPIPSAFQGSESDSIFNKDLGITDVPGQTNATFIDTTAKTANK
jgi:hypothetical protein